MNLRIAIALVFIPLTNLHAQTTRPIPQIDRVLIISIDGLRPDVALRADTPNIHALCVRGSFSFWALTVPVSITLPSHVSMLTGVVPEKHGINFNDERATTVPTYPTAPTIFEIAHAANLRTALVSGKEKFGVFARPGILDWHWLPTDGKKVVTDEDVATAAIAILREHQPQVMFVHFPGADVAGHAKGWGSAEQLNIVAQIDSHVGEIFRTLDSENLTDSTLIILTADHGGSGRQHDATDPANRYIPWIAAGPGVQQNFDLTLNRKLTINTTDTFATACYFLGLPIPEGIDGKPIDAIIQRRELIHETSTRPN